MPINLRVILFIFSIFLLLITTYILRKGRIPEKYSLLWYFIAVVIFLLSVLPSIFTFIAKQLGFQVMSNLIIGIILVLLLFLTMALTIIASGQKKKITLLIQEISIIRQEVENKNGK